MPLYNFDSHQEFISIDKIPDNRSDDQKLNSMLSLYNHQKPDLALAERWAEEMINQAGAWLSVYNRTRDGQRDEVWDENADPTFSKAIKLKGMFAPQPVEAQMTKWGVDTQNQLTIHFSRANVFKLFGNRMIAEGDTIIVPHNTLSVVQNNDLREGVGNRMDRYRVIKANDTGNFHYRWLFWSCLSENLTGDKTIDVQHSKERA